jgi:hypothetical protein
MAPAPKTANKKADQYKFDNGMFIGNSRATLVVDVQGRQVDSAPDGARFHLP